MRVLLVDDNRANVEYFVDALEGDGHAVCVERDGTGGLARALAESFDVILLDIQLPRLAGDAVCRELRASGVRTPIVAITSSAMPEQVERGLASGFNGYLTKPISLSALRAAVNGYRQATR